MISALSAIAFFRRRLVLLVSTRCHYKPGTIKKKLISLSKYSVVISFSCSKYKKYTSEPKFKFSKSDTITVKSSEFAGVL